MGNTASAQPTTQEQTTQVPQQTTEEQPLMNGSQQTYGSQPVQISEITEPEPVTSTQIPEYVPEKRGRAPKYVHPFIQLINNNANESEMVNTLQIYCGSTEIGQDEEGKPIYESVDQTMFIAPALQLFSYCATNNKIRVVKWLLDNFVPLQVSYEKNFCYFECVKFHYYDIADLIAQHESFDPTMVALDNLISRNKYDIFKKCMSSPYLTGLMNKYRYTFMRYVDKQQYSKINDLLGKIKQAGNVEGSEVVISNKVRTYSKPTENVQDV